ncbi:MAG: hypothetical protein KDB24_08060 [Microthrixaceae bacterium]|nr:hypothetical protein [Microthrixaceae bacterium]
MSEATTPAEPHDSREVAHKKDTLELFAVALMALTAVMTAWSAFEASKWGGVMSINFAEAGATRTESIRASNLANQQFAVDVSLFTEFADATANDQPELATFYRNRFPDRLAVATDAWLETKPFQTDDAPSSPFDMDDYVLEANIEAEDLQNQADQKSEDARTANQDGDNYTITSVLFATVILLAALSGKVRTLRTARLLLGLSVVLFIGSVAIIATYPIEI